MGNLSVDGDQFKIPVAPVSVFFILSWISSVKYCLHSDNEEDRCRSSHNGQSVKEFKDEETVTTKSVHIVQATETTATRKRGAPSKKVDLGAAAHYTGDKSPDTTAKQVEKICMNTENKS